MHATRSYPVRARAAIWLALWVFVLKALVPQGFMPDVRPGGVLIQLCSSAGPVWVQAPHQAGHHQDTQHAEQSAVCPVGAALGALPLLPSALPAAPIAAAALLIAARAPPLPPGHAPPGAPLGARAPPVSRG